jgi:Asp-tRNA(Asn)/Glu-tRNA(Gln) amidotransferase A subunit family amidase
MIRHLRRIFKEVDVIATPMTAIPAPLIPTDIAPNEDESDIAKQGAIMRYVHLANLSGHPACTVTVGYTDDRHPLPISLQFIGRAWDEDTLISLGIVLERNFARKKPQEYFDLMQSRR